ncbi:MAG: VWA domain-containing protein [Terracidiphilus sp.]|jgi:VWFA-related protein
MRLRLPPLLPSLLCAGLAAPLSALPPQTPSASEPAPDTSYTYRTTVSSVVLDVVVTDGRGNLVPGLTSDNFRVTEDGAPQTVDFFEPHIDEAPGPVAHLPREQPGVYNNIPTVQPSGSIDVLLVDSLNTELADQAYVRQQLLKFLEAEPPGMRIAIFTLGSRLRLLQGFTADPTVLQAALKSKAGKAMLQNPALLVSAEEASTENKITQVFQEELAQAENSAQANQTTLSPGEATIQGQMLDLQNFLVESHTFETDYRILTTIRAMQAIARYLSVLPGRKNLIWLSGSFPLAVMPNAPGASTTILPAAAGTLPGSSNLAYDYDSALRMTANLLTKAQIAVYPLDAHGVSLNPMFQAAVNTNFVNNAMDPSPKVGGDQNRNFEQQQAQNHDTMDMLARETGGEPFYNTNGIAEAVARAIHLGSNYYTIAYTPTNQDQDGRLRKIEIKLDRGKYKLSYHRSYFSDQAPGAPEGIGLAPDNSFGAAMVYGLPMATQIVFKVRAVPADSQPPATPVSGGKVKLKGPVTHYTLDYAAALRGFKLSLAPDGLRHGTMVVSAIAYGKDGSRLNSFGKSISFNLDRANYAQFLSSGLPIREELDLPAGEVYLRTGLYDPASGNIGTLEIPLKVSARGVETAAIEPGAPPK